MIDAELCWMAGFFEGEGTVRINSLTRRNLGALVVSVVNTDRQPIDWFHARFGGYKKPATGLGPAQKPAWVWVVAACHAAVVLRQLRPYIRREIVRQKIDHGLRFQSQKSNSPKVNRTYEYREAQFCDWLWMRELNARGVNACPKAAKFRGKS